MRRRKVDAQAIHAAIGHRKRGNMILIQDGYLIDPKSGLEGKYDVLIDGERIARIAKHIERASIKDKKLEVINAEGLLVAPGLVDVHVHFRDPGFTQKEDITTGAKAAAHGGVTSVVLMANTKPTVDTEETLRYVMDKGAQTGIRVHTCANVTMGMQGKQITEMEKLAAAGAVGFTDDGIPILDEQVVREAMERAAALDLPLSFHEEDPKYIENNGVNRGKASAHFGIGGADREAEIAMVGRDLELALETGATIDIQHISSKEAVELVRRAKERGNGNIHAEATPHHYTLTEDAVIEYGTLAKMNPPLREEADRQAIIEGLVDGTIDMIATDHAPHTAEEKGKPLTEAPSGITGLETSLALGITKLVDGGYLTMKELLRLMSTNPAALYHLDAGYLAEGGPADVILVDTAAEYIPVEYASKATNTPFTGWTLHGAVVKTICRGEVVWG